MKLKIYKLSSDYVNYLRFYDEKVLIHKEEFGRSRPYVGIILKINNFDYFAPLSSSVKKIHKYELPILNSEKNIIAKIRINCKDRGKILTRKIHTILVKYILFNFSHLFSMLV
jgi:protein AbiQ